MKTGGGCEARRDLPGSLDPVEGSEQGGTRPLLIIQNDVGNRFSQTAIVAAVTSRTLNPYPFLVSLPPGVLPRPSSVNCAQLRTVDRSPLEDVRIATLDDATMARVDAALRISLGLD